MLPHSERCSTSCLKKTLAVILGLSIVMIGLCIIFSRPYDTNISAIFGMTSLFNKGNENNDTKLKPRFTCDREKVGKSSFELSDYVFQSPYIISPKVYTKTVTNTALNSSRKVKVIGCYNCNTQRWFNDNDMFQQNRDFKACPYSECVIDFKSSKNTPDVVLFFVGSIGKAKVPTRPPGQIWMMCFWESPVHFDYPTPYALWKNAFNWTFNYRTDSDIFVPMNYLTWRNSSELMSDQFYLERAKNKTKTAAWFVSNCHTHGKREDYVKEMQKYIDVDIYGGCGSMSCPRSQATVCETNLTTTYKFYLSFENSLCKDYVTEKFYRTFQYRSHIIPVVRGGFDYDRYVPQGIFVNAEHFPSAKDLALYLQDLGNDHVRYSRMLRDKDRLTTKNARVDWCDVCERIHTHEAETKVIPDIKKWSHDGACHPPADIGHS